MNTIFAIVIVLWFKGGLTMTQTVQAPSLEDCQAGRPLLLKNVEGHKVTLSDGQTLEVLGASASKCIRIDRAYAA